MQIGINIIEEKKEVDLMKLNKSENGTVRDEIIKYLGVRKVPTPELTLQVFENVRLEIPNCKPCNVTGLVSGMTKEGKIHCSNGMCWR